VPDARGRLVYSAYRGAAWLAQTVPAPVAASLAHVAGRGARYALPARTRMATRHQRRIHAEASETEISDAVRDVFDSYARYWMEIFRIPAEVRRGTIEQHCRVQGYENVVEGLAHGKGVVLAGPHLGGWEWAAAWMALPPRNHHMLAVVEHLEPRELFEWFARQREAMGMEIVELGPDVSKKALRALRDNRILCLLSDRDLTGDGVEVEFFGERTTLPAGPATLCLRTGATLLPVAAYFQPDGGHLADIRPPIPVERSGRVKDDVARITQALAHEFERLIEAAPEQWHLLQPNWPSDANGTGAKNGDACASR
jgi:KDO2-lipid IV(A) lauroyltransferase